MSSTQPVATNATAFQLSTPLTAPPAPAPLALREEAPQPPKDVFGQQAARKAAQKLGATWRAVADSTHVEAAKLWVCGVGAVAGYALPAAALVEGARLASQLNGGDPSHVFFATCAGGVAAVGNVIFQSKECMGNIELYKREGYSMPRLLSFLDVAVCAVAPALAGAYFGGQHYGPWWGNAIGCGAAIVGSSVALVHMHVRQKRLQGGS